MQVPDKEKIFQTVNPIKYLKLGKETCKKTMEKYEAIEYCWINYWIIYSKIKKNEFNPVDLKKDAENWLIFFVKAYGKDAITPYIHSFVHHFYEFMQLHGDVNLFNEQGLEKLNDLTTSQFYRSTNKKNFITQLLNLRNRVEVLSSEFA